MPLPIELHDDVVNLIGTLTRAGFESWIVGGAVRDHLRGLPANDVDIATSATSDELQRVFPRAVATGAAHGTVTIPLGTHDPVEVTTFRLDVSTDGRRATVAWGKTIEEDLARRDFSINAIAWNPVTGQWADPFAGRQALLDNRLEAVGEPSRRFAEDHLRMIRALRFAARFQMTIAPETWEAITRLASETRHLSAERVHMEWSKGIETAASVEHFLQLWQRSGIGQHWMRSIRLDSPVLRAGDFQALERTQRSWPLVSGMVLSDPVTDMASIRASREESLIARIGHAAPPQATDPVTLRRFASQEQSGLEHWQRRAQWERAEWGEPLARIIQANPPLRLSDLAVDGAALVAAGWTPGPEMGRALSHLLSCVLDNPAMNTAPRLLALAGQPPKRSMGRGR